MSSGMSAGDDDPHILYLFYAGSKFGRSPNLIPSHSHLQKEQQKEREEERKITFMTTKGQILLVRT